MKTQKTRRTTLALMMTLVMILSVLGSTMVAGAATTGIKTFQNFESAAFVAGDLPNAAYEAWGGVYCMWIPNWFDQEYAIDGSGMAQGDNSLEIRVSESNSGKFAFRTFALAENAAGFKALDGMAFYLNLPASNYTAAETAGFNLSFAFGDAAGANTVMANATVTYYFKDGSVLVKTAQGGLYPYNAAGAITDDGFEGYVAISYTGIAITEANFNTLYLDMPLTENIALLGKSVYVDDFVEYDADAIQGYVNGILGIVEETSSAASSSTATSENPQTGDSAPAVLAIVLLAAMGTVVLLKRKSVSVK